MTTTKAVNSAWPTIEAMLEERCTCQVCTSPPPPGSAQIATCQLCDTPRWGDDMMHYTCSHCRMLRREYNHFQRKNKMGKQYYYPWERRGKG